MTGKRWWDVFFAATVIVVAALAWVSDFPGPAARPGAWVTLGLLVVAYLGIGRRALADGRLALPFAIVVVAASGACVAFSPNTAIIQAIAFPMLWSAIDSTRLAVVANVALALAVSAGFVISLGTTPDAIAQTVVIEGISLVGSLALGIWITQIAHLSHERKQLLDDLTEAQEQLAALNRETGITSERERLAREIHDTIAQDLTGLVMLTQRAQRELAAGRTSEAAGHLGVLEEGARNALAETRALVASAAPVGLAGGIVDAMQRLAERFSRETGVTVGVEADDLPPLERDTEVVLLRIAQEGLANVRKHSRAESAVIELRVAGGSVQLTVRDDGVGFDREKATNGFGLSGMRDRLALVGGTLDVSSDDGTTLVARLPIGAGS